MSAPDPLADVMRLDNAITDDLVQRRFGAEPVADPSGVLLPSEPIPADADEDAQFAACMARCFPQAAG